MSCHIISYYYSAIWRFVDDNIVLVNFCALCLTMNMSKRINTLAIKIIFVGSVCMWWEMFGCYSDYFYLILIFSQSDDTFICWFDCFWCRRRRRCCFSADFFSLLNFCLVLWNYLNCIHFSKMMAHCAFCICDRDSTETKY